MLPLSHTFLVNVYFSLTIELLTLKFSSITMFLDSFQFVLCFYLQLSLSFMLLYANEVKRVNKDRPVFQAYCSYRVHYRSLNCIGVTSL